MHCTGNFKNSYYVVKLMAQFGNIVMWVILLKCITICSTLSEKLHQANIGYLWALLVAMATITLNKEFRQAIQHAYFNPNHCLQPETNLGSRVTHNKTKKRKWPMTAFSPNLQVPEVKCYFQNHSQLLIFICFQKL